MIRYRLTVGLAIAVLFAAQRSLPLHASGTGLAALGYLLSLAMLAAVAEFAALALGGRLARRPGIGGGLVPVPAVLAIASALLAMNACSKELGGVLALPPSRPPTVPLALLVAGWLLVLLWVRRRGCARGTLALALVGLVFGTRVLVLGIWPFDRLDGDMLPTIDLALDAMAAGRFPYDDFPPPMPYLPGTFLAYAPAKLLGWDLRATNLLLECLTVAAAVLLAPGPGRSGPGTPIVGVELGRIALPLLMLHPVWAHFGANTQYAPSVLAAALLGLAVASAGPRAQAVALGLAVGTNQMLVACGPVLVAAWIGRIGPARALGLAGLAGLVFSAMIAPFAIRDPARFVEVAFLGRHAFPPELMAGRFTLLPLVSGVVPRAGAVLSVAAVLVAAGAARSARRPEAVVACMALGLCVALLFQPTSFPHYVLPVLALVAGAPALPPARSAQRPPVSSRSRFSAR